MTKKKFTGVYCKGFFGDMNGKTANGLARYSDKYKISGIIDSTKTGLDAGEVLGDKPNKIPIYKNLQEALDGKGGSIAAFIYGMTPLSGAFSSIDRDVMFYAIEGNLDIVNGLHDFLTDDASFVQKAAECSVPLHDIRKQQGIKQRTTLGDHPSLSLPARAKHQASPQNLRSVSKNAT